MELEKDYALSEMRNKFDLDRDGRIQEHEFIDGCSKMIDEVTQLAKNDNSTAKKILQEACTL